MNLKTEIAKIEKELEEHIEAQNKEFNELVLKQENERQEMQERLTNSENQKRQKSMEAINKLIDEADKLLNQKSNTPEPVGK